MHTTKTVILRLKKKTKQVPKRWSKKYHNFLSISLSLLYNQNSKLTKYSQQVLLTFQTYQFSNLLLHSSRD